jgi:hypothetical protein
MSQLNEIIGLFQEETIRINKIIHIPLAFANCDAPSDDLEELLEFANTEDWPPELAAALKDTQDASVEEMLEAIADANLRGFLVDLNTPVRTYHGGPYDGSSFSWGHYASKWFFVPSLEEIAEPADVWLKECEAKWRAESAKGGAS